MIDRIKLIPEMQTVWDILLGLGYQKGLELIQNDLIWVNRITITRDPDDNEYICSVLPGESRHIPRESRRISPHYGSILDVIRFVLKYEPLRYNTNRTH